MLTTGAGGQGTKEVHKNRLRTFIFPVQSNPLKILQAYFFLLDASLSQFQTRSPRQLQ